MGYRIYFDVFLFIFRLCLTIYRPRTIRSDTSTSATNEPRTAS